MMSKSSDSVGIQVLRLQSAASELLKSLSKKSLEKKGVFLAQRDNSELIGIKDKIIKGGSVDPDTLDEVAIANLIKLIFKELSLLNNHLVPYSIITTSGSTYKINFQKLNKINTNNKAIFISLLKIVDKVLENVYAYPSHIANALAINIWNNIISDETALKQPAFLYIINNREDILNILEGKKINVSEQEVMVNAPKQEEIVNAPKQEEIVNAPKQEEIVNAPEQAPKQNLPKENIKDPKQDKLDDLKILIKNKTFSVGFLGLGIFAGTITRVDGQNKKLPSRVSRIYYKIEDKELSPEARVSKIIELALEALNDKTTHFQQDSTRDFYRTVIKILTTNTLTQETKDDLNFRLPLR